MHAKAQQVCSLLDSASALEARLEHKDERGAVGVLVVLAVHELVEGGHGWRTLQQGGLDAVREAEVGCVGRDGFALGVLVQHLSMHSALFSHGHGHCEHMACALSSLAQRPRAQLHKHTVRIEKGVPSFINTEQLQQKGLATSERTSLSLHNTVQTPLYRYMDHSLLCKAR